MEVGHLYSPLEFAYIAIERLAYVTIPAAFSIRGILDCGLSSRKILQILRLDAADLCVYGQEITCSTGCPASH